MPLIERAYQMAASGDYSATDEIRRALKAEGYEQVDAHLTGPSLQKQLKAAMTGAARPGDKG